MCSKCLARMHSGGFPSHPGRAEGGRAFRRNDYRLSQSILEKHDSGDVSWNPVSRIDFGYFLSDCLPGGQQGGRLGGSRAILLSIPHVKVCILRRGIDFEEIEGITECISKQTFLVPSAPSRARPAHPTRRAEGTRNVCFPPTALIPTHSP